MKVTLAVETAEAIFEGLSCGIEPSPTLLADFYEQIESSVRPYTIASHVDIDSDGPVKGHGEITLGAGGLAGYVDASAIPNVNLLYVGITNMSNFKSAIVIKF